MLSAMTRYLLTGACLIILVWGVYSQTRQFDFVEFDDPQLITENGFVRQGVTPEGVKWALFSAWRENVFYYPLSLLSHMADVTWFGLNAGRHHLTSVALHAAVAVSFFGLLVQVSGAFWRPALAAALFAVHPLGVDSVAWVAERSNLLCALLVIASLWAFARFKAGSGKSGYMLSLGLFFLALSAKPTAVMMPLVLWLCRRPPESTAIPVIHHRSAALRHLMELSPFLMLAALRLTAVLTAGQGASPVTAAESMTFGTLVANAVTSVTAYLVDVFYPFQLSVYYPFPVSIPLWQPLLSGLLLLIISVAAFIYRRRRPMTWMGWLWFLIFLMPSFGVIRSGPWPARADHYVYIPLMGLLSALVWLVPIQASGSLRRKMTAGFGAVVLLTYLGTAAVKHAGHYRDSETLFSRALTLNADNFLACIELGNAYRRQNRMDLAEKYFRQAVTIKPDSPGAHNNLGLVLSAKGNWTEAESHFKAALALCPGFSPARSNLANLYLKQRRTANKPAGRHDADIVSPAEQ